jgi:hypothetical protein
VFQWLIVVSADGPTSDPYIPCAKRPPAYLAGSLTWLNSAIEGAADSIAPFISARRAFPHNSFGRKSPSICTCVRLHVCLAFLSWWVLRLSPHQWYRWQFCPWSHLLACSLIQAGIAQANSVAADRETRERTIFDTDLFDILVDGGATSCISNNLADFISPSKTTTVHVQGFNGTTSSAQIGTVWWLCIC